MIAEALLQVRSRIALAEARTGRPEGSVKLVCVSKKHPASAIREAYALGERRFGESYAQELVDKAAQLRDLQDIEWHFIGHLQSNKAKLVARIAHTVHAVDSAPLARELGRRASARKAPLPVLIEVNVSGEAHKHGIAPEGVPGLVAAVQAEPSLSLAGLMTMPPASDEEAAKHVFFALRALRDRVTPSLPELSMGMSDDLESAVACGSTYVRIGTAIFGARGP